MAKVVIANFPHVLMSAERMALPSPAWAREWVMKRVPQHVLREKVNLKDATLSEADALKLLENSVWDYERSYTPLPSECARVAQICRDLIHRAAAEQGELFQFIWPSMAFNSKLSEVVDWLHHLENVADPLAGKLGRLTLKQAIGHSDAWHADLARQDAEEHATAAREVELFLEVPGAPELPGYRWVELKTEAARDFEGAAMGHCVGEGGYDDCRILSLRDPENQPHATVELHEADGEIEIVQLKGKQNRPPVQRYLPAISALVDHLRPVSVEDVRMMGYFHEPRGPLLTAQQYVDRLERERDMIAFGGLMPHPLVIRRPLACSSLAIAHVEGLTAIEAGLTTQGDLTLSGCDNLTAISGSLHGSRIRIEAMQALESITGAIHCEDLTLQRNPALRSLKGPMSIPGYLWLDNLPNLVELPPGCVTKTLELRDSHALEVIPEGWQMTKDAYIIRADGLRELPESFIAPSVFCFQVSFAKSLTKLPSQVKCHTLSLSDCDSLEVIPEGWESYSLSLENLPSLRDISPDLKADSITVSNCPSLSEDSIEVLVRLGAWFRETKSKEPPARTAGLSVPGC